jgi:hypothetical protein
VASENFLRRLSHNVYTQRQVQVVPTVPPRRPKLECHILHELALIQPQELHLCRFRRLAKFCSLAPSRHQATLYNSTVPPQALIGIATQDFEHIFGCSKKQAAMADILMGGFDDDSSYASESPALGVELGLNRTH